MKSTLLLLILLLFTSVALAIDKHQAMNIAQQSHPGRVLSVKQTSSTYRVKILSASGDVRVIVIDAKNGKVVN